MRYPAFIGGSAVAQSPTFNPERTINWYWEPRESDGALSDSALFPTPGVTELSSVAVGPGRAHYAVADREWAIIGTTLYEINETGTATSKGTVAIDTNPATISYNGDGGGELFITSGGNGYVYNIAAETLTQIVALNGLATMGAFLDGYFLALSSSNATMYVSDLLDGTTWTTGVMFAQRSIAPDPWNSMAVSNRYIWLFGEQTAEIWYNAGTSPFPFAPHPSGLIPFGCAAPFSPITKQGTLVWISRSGIGTGMVHRATGFSPDRVSTYAEQVAFEGFAELSSATGDGYEDQGHQFFMFNVPSAGSTRVWDSRTAKWFEQGTWYSAESVYKNWRPRWHAYVFGQHRWLDSETGSIYRSGSTLTSDVDGEVIRRLRRSPIMHFENERLFVSSFELELEAGLGTQTGQGANPQVMLRQSLDGGKTWETEQMRGAGKVGQYGTRVRWDRLGAARKRCIEITVTDPIPWRIIDAFVELPQSPRGIGSTLGQQRSR